MSKRDYLIRYLLIIKKLRRSGTATFNEINDHIRLEFELLDSPRDVSLRTFQRDLNEIRTIFNIDIKCNNSNQYYIVEEESPGFNNRMIEAFDIINALNVGQNLSPYVLLEKRCSIGTEHIFGLLHAIRNRSIIKFSYEKFAEPGVTTREAEPYALKEFKGRWYLLSKDRRDNYIKTFGLDRLTDLELTRKKFVFPSDLNPERYFENCFGIITSVESEPEVIILSFNALQGKYVKSFPLHETQKILHDTKDELLIQLKLYITHDLIMELLSYGYNVKVIKPVSLIDDLKTTYQSALTLY